MSNSRLIINDSEVKELQRLIEKTQKESNLSIAEAIFFTSERLAFGAADITKRSPEKRKIKVDQKRKKIENDRAKRLNREVKESRFKYIEAWGYSGKYKSPKIIEKIWGEITDKKLKVPSRGASKQIWKNIGVAIQKKIKNYVAPKNGGGFKLTDVTNQISARLDNNIYYARDAMSNKDGFLFSRIVTKFEKQFNKRMQSFKKRNNL